MSVEVAPSRSRTEAVRNASSFFLSVFVLHVRCDVAEWSDLLLRVMRDPCLFVHETRVCSRLPVCFQAVVFF